VSVGGHQYRLIGCDTPETARAKCDAERNVGNRATARLEQLLLGRDFALERVRCSCRPGEEERVWWCNRKRRCGILTVGSVNVCTTLIAERLARPFICGETRCPKRQPWC
jgi:endonuclease YncB( thermonuclease family)